MFRVDKADLGHRLRSAMEYNDAVKAARKIWDGVSLVWRADDGWHVLLHADGPRHRIDNEGNQLCQC